MATVPSMWTVVVAAGSGTRFGGAKQYLELAGSRIVDRSVAVAAQVSDGVVVVVPAGDVEAESARLAASAVVAGGPSRAASVRNGLDAVPHDADIICVHDAARPLASPDIYERVVHEVRSGAAGAVPVVPVTDTIRSVDGGVVDRSTLQAVQTPQAFRAELLRMAPHRRRRRHRRRQLGGGGWLCRGGSGGPSPQYQDHQSRRSGRRRGMVDDMSGQIRVGHGFDTHRFSDDPDRALILGGVRFEGAPGLVGHSDGDAVAHAVTDALLSAAGLGDIGVLFPDTDEAWAGADSLELLADAVARLADAGWAVVNADCTVVAEAPRIASQRDEMQTRLSSAAGAPVTVKGKRAEALGALGRGEGLACWAVALIERQ